jgi:hypothetical protein
VDAQERKKTAVVDLAVNGQLDLAAVVNDST